MSPPNDPEFIPFCRPTIEEEEIASVVQSLRSGWLTTGPKVLEFERMWREACGVPHAVALNSATAGLHVALAAMDVGPGDEVVTTSLTWPATSNVVELLGATTVFADVDPATLLLDPADVRRRMTPRTKAVIPVHFAGQPVDLDAFAEVVRGTKAVILEDAAHAAGTEYRGVRIGAGANTAVFSFHPIKNITTGEGGIVTTRDDALAERMKLLRFHGVSKDAWSRYGRTGSPRYEVLEPGWKYNMLDLQAALGIEQTKKLDRFNAARTERALRYHELLADVPEVRPLAAAAWPHRHAWHLYVVRLDLARLTIDRDAFVGELAREGIGAGLHFTPVHRHRHYREKYAFREGHLPATEQVGEEILSLPLYPLLRPADQERVAAAVKRIVARNRRRV